MRSRMNRRFVHCELTQKEGASADEQHGVPRDFGGKSDGGAGRDGAVQ
jgi:hypothetical protein